MLRSLTVKNLAIIDNINIDFNDGMTVLTGETGAGKSLIIDAIALLFGDRASSELVRDGQTKTFIEGVFTEYNHKVKQILIDEDIEDEDVLIIRREIFQTGKSVGKVNGTTVPISVLSQIGNELGNIHTQFDTHKLINPSNYYIYLDDEETLSILKDYKDSLSQFRKAQRKYNQLVNQESAANQKLDYLKFQISELEKANLSVGEEEVLLKESKVFSNYEKIMNNYSDFINAYEKNNILDIIYDSISSLEKISEYDDTLIEKKNLLNEIYYNLNDLVYDINNSFKKIDFNEEDSDRINNRLGLYSDLKRKYKMSTSDIICYFEKIKEEVNLLENHDFYLAEAKKEYEFSLQKLTALADNITNKRINNSKLLENNIRNSLFDLQLKNVDFKIVIEKGDFKDQGQDLIDFLVSFNKGEQVKPLSKTASGGELSRFMLALKETSSKNMLNQTLIFDEIDTGVSGEVAFCIASKIKEISKYAQVLCVTHLPQVASISDNHYNISKRTIDNKTITEIKSLAVDERLKIIASMLSNGNITNASLELARELLKI